MRRFAMVVVTLVLAAAAAVAAVEQRGRGRMATMALTASAFPSGGAMPSPHTQAGAERSPALSWTGAPEGVESFVLIVHDVTVPAGDGRDDLLYWMVWNIPGTATGLPENVPSGDELEDGTRQISVTGPYYRGPAAAPSAPPHHVVFDLYALDTTLAVRPGGDSPAETRAEVIEAMAGHIRGRATLVGVVGGQMIR